MRRQTEHAIKLQDMYAKEDGRLKGKDRWEKFPLFWFHLWFIRLMSTLVLHKITWTWQEPCCLRPIEQQKEAPDHVHIGSLSCFQSEGYYL